MPFIVDCTSDHAEMQPSVELPPTTTAPATNSWSVDVEPSDTDGTSDGSETTLVDGFLDDTEPPSPLDTPFSTDGSDFCHIGAQFGFEDPGNYSSYIVQYPSSFESNSHHVELVPSVSDTEPRRVPHHRG